MQDEVVKHTMKIYDAVKDPKHSFFEKLKEVLIEIFIIVFAVTLSIWLHNWSDHRHEQREAREFLQGLKTDLAQDIELLEENRGSAVRLDSNFRRLIALNDSKAIDTVGHELLRTLLNFEVNATHANLARYEGFKSSGKIGTIENDSLRQAILVYYQQTMPGVVDIEDVVNAIQRKTIDTETDKVETFSLKDISKSFKMRAFYELLTQNLDGEVRAYEHAEKHARRIIARIDGVE